MRITEVKSFVLSKPRDLHIVKIETDAGIYGIGEAGCSTREWAQDGMVMHFRDFLIGMDPMRIEHIWQKCYRGAYYEGGRVITGTLAAIDMALYDIVGKKTGRAGLSTPWRRLPRQGLWLYYAGPPGRSRYRRAHARGRRRRMARHPLFSRRRHRT